ncbi:amidohydrolase family protein, partial [Clostridioides difficile]|uniref:amidohydrolase family protein n=1 Tax=Clostridioides difficile TaxID=1496 RepID=UPI001F4134F9
KIWLAPAAKWSNSHEMLEMLCRVVKEYDDALFTVHIEETAFDREAAKELHGEYDIDVLEKLGVLGPNVLMVHCVYLTDKDMELTKKYDMQVSHNTASNMYFSSGVAPMPDMLT